jgi:uncharacterized protein (TIGR03067 family)
MRKTSLVVLTLLALSPWLVRADDDPEPPGKGGPELRKLRGKWVGTRLISRGKEGKLGQGITYVFDGDKLTYESGKRTYSAKVKVDAKNKVRLLEVTRDDTKATVKWAFEIRKGELYLAIKGEDLTKEDFSGNNGIVMVLEREKK